MSQQSHPTGTLANLPQPPSNPDTPSEMPGTPTSTTTSLSALSTTAIKDGHRGHVHHGSGPHTSNRFSGDYTRNPPSNPEAERNDRISRLPGMMSALRGVQSSGSTGTPQQGINNPSYGQSSYYQQQQQNQQNNPNVPVTPAYFDAAGQPRAATKMSTVGSASATDSAYEGITTASFSATSHAGTNTETAPDLDDGDDQSMTMNLDPRDNDTDMPTTSPPASGYATGPDAMEDDEENLATRSVGTFEDRMSDYDDGRESLVGFGEGAGSTVSGPIYHRRPLPGQNIPGGPAGWGLERSSSGLSDMLAGSGAGSGGLPPTSSGSVGRGGAGSGGRDVIRDIIRREGGMLQDREYSGSGGNDSTPASQSAVSNERRDARMVDGVAFDRDHNSAAAGARVRSQFAPMDEDFVDTTATGPLPLPQNYSPTSAGRHHREERPRSNQQQHHPYPFQQYQHHPQQQHQQQQQAAGQQQQQQQQQQQHSQTCSEFQLRPMDVSSPMTPPTGEADPRETAERMLEDSLTAHEWKNM